MLKKRIQNYLPSKERLKASKSLRFLGDRLFANDLWHINRKSIAKAFLVGVFAALIPIPFQMVLAAILALYIQGYLPVSIALVWLTNPVTMPFVFYFTYKVGCLILDVPVHNTGFEISWAWFMEKLSSIWKPLYLGSLVCAVIASIISYFTVNFLWKLHVIRRWKQRKNKPQ